jgi:hypothetical protein
VTPLAGQTRQKVFVLGELDLKATFPGAGAPPEDVQNERRPVNDLNAQGVLQVLLLVWGQLVIQDEDVVIGGIFKGE